MFQEAAALAQSLQAPRALSYAWGYLGRLYEEAHRYDEALDLTRRAAFAAQQVHAPESLYQWQWQTGRLLRALGQVQPALEAYTRAVETVQALHATLGRGQGASTPRSERRWGPSTSSGRICCSNRRRPWRRSRRSAAILSMTRISGKPVPLSNC